MANHFLNQTILASVLAFGLAGVTFAQSTATEDAKKAGEATKDAGKDVVEAAKDAGKATAKVTKKVGLSVKKAVTLDTTTAACKDGTVQKGKTKTTACDDHGGVK
jgi:hypothetical protein